MRQFASRLAKCVALHHSLCLSCQQSVESLLGTGISYSVQDHVGTALCISHLTAQCSLMVIVLVTVDVSARSPLCCADHVAVAAEAHATIALCMQGPNRNVWHIVRQRTHGGSK